MAKNKQSKRNMPQDALSKPVILAIDTSCDDTSVAVLQGRQVLSSVISSQVDLHQKWGGVVPDIARRAHQDNILPVYQEALKRARISEQQINFVAVTLGPGLAISLEVGIKFAKDLAKTLNVPFVPVDHMEGHLLAPLSLNRNGNGTVPSGNEQQYFPALALLVSGNHTEIVWAKQIGEYKILGETLDDAAGEAFDKVARMMNLGYPGGPIITMLAQKADKTWQDKELGVQRKNGRRKKKNISGKFGLPIPMLESGDLNFSFSGLKTACLYTIKELRQEYKSDNQWANEFARAFINAVSQQLQAKLTQALKQHPEVKTVILGGGVANNIYLVREIGQLARQHNKHFLLPEIRFRSDNAGMIGIAAYYRIKQNQNIISDHAKMDQLDRVPMLSLEENMV